jgi:hypothetical protein
MDGQDIVRTLWEVAVALARVVRFVFGFLVWSGQRLYQLYRAHNPKPFSFPPEARFEHTHIVGGSGHGKTEMLKTMILDVWRQSKPARPQ